MWLKWIPWKTFIKHMAKGSGFLDPINLISYFERFSEPSEVSMPMELLRSGAIMHARGLINSRAIQHNMDWIWPYWAQKQFDPNSNSFIPRSFSLTHINLTYRNWTALGVPNFSNYAIVDPKGLVTPVFDKWSIDAWIIFNDENKNIIPSKNSNSNQYLISDKMATLTETTNKWGALRSKSEVLIENDELISRNIYTVETKTDGFLVISIRPYNPEGISFIHDIFLRNQNQLGIDDMNVFFSQNFEKLLLSKYSEGDVYHKSKTTSEIAKAAYVEKFKECSVGMASAAAIYPVNTSESKVIQVDVPINTEKKINLKIKNKKYIWKNETVDATKISIPEDKNEKLFYQSLNYIILLSPKKIYPGPYTYRRFWIRDATYILYAMLCAGLEKRAEKCIESIFEYQRRNGYFHSQAGEWDANGEALWIMGKYLELTGKSCPKAWIKPIVKASNWIINKIPKNAHNLVHFGLLPPGFSAEHLGPNDYYYWDDFWSAAGLDYAAQILRTQKMYKVAKKINVARNKLLNSIETSLEKASKRLERKAMPASPTRRLDSGAIGSIVAGYPLMLFSNMDQRLLDTADYLFKNHIIHDGFFHDVIHSGINPYLTLHLAQVFLRSGDLRSKTLIDSIQKLASQTGTWPEAIHPITLGGCMGDGHHNWAAAEWVLIMRNSFFIEEIKQNTLVVGSGIFGNPQKEKNEYFFGPAPTKWGKVTIKIKEDRDSFHLFLDAKWRNNIPKIKIVIPNTKTQYLPENKNELTVYKKNN